MKSGQIFGAVCALASIAAASPAQTITPITTYGNAFFAGNDRFYIRGLDYQPGNSAKPVDPLANPTTCLRDIKYFKMLGINTIRVYTIDNTANHDTCMNALAAAGIYLALDVNSGLYSINRADPAPSYNNVYLQNVFAIIDKFHQYDNTLLFFSGNEIINTAQNTNTAPYIKAVTRDMKTYIQARGYRQIPVGYSAADIIQNRYQTAEYMNCGTDGMARSDFFAFNDYQWCGASSFVQSGWSTDIQTFGNYSLPLFLSEYGCNLVLPRTFTEVQALYNKEMTSVYSGGLVYEYTEEADNPNYGLVQVKGPNTVQELTDFGNLMQEFQANPIPAGDGGYKKDLPPSPCPPASHWWQVKTEALPAMPVLAEKYMKDGAGPGVGLGGTGSQFSGTQSTGFITVHAPGVTPGAKPGAPDSSSAAAPIRPAEWPMLAMVSGAAVVMSTFLGASLL